MTLQSAVFVGEPLDTIDIMRVVVFPANHLAKRTNKQNQMTQRKYTTQ